MPDLRRGTVEAAVRALARRPGFVRTVARVVPFDVWERNGWHLTPNHYYSPIPDVAALPDAMWDRPSELPGIDLREAAQVELLRTLAERYGDELAAFPTAPAGPGRFHVGNGSFGAVDAEVYYGLVRHLRPRRVVEIGAGWSTLVALDAAARNAADGAPCAVEAVEPYPCDFIERRAAEDPLLDLTAAPLESLPLDRFTSLAAGDVLFIDSSHVLRAGSDVQYEFLELLPRLRPGVYVHVHDVFLPYEYPREWVTGEHRFWNEQYLLQAFLAGNAGVEVVWAGNYLHHTRQDLLERCIPSYDRTRCQPGSFWFRVVEPRP